MSIVNQEQQDLEECKKKRHMDEHKSKKRWNKEIIVNSVIKISFGGIYIQQNFHFVKWELWNIWEAKKKITTVDIRVL